MSPESPEIPHVSELTGEHEHHHDRHGRLIAVAIVLTTLAAALVAYAQAAALRTHDEADARAERNGALALSAAAIANDESRAQVDRFDLLQSEERRADNAALFEQYGAGSAATKLEAARWTQIAHQTYADTRAIAKSEGLPYICSPSHDAPCPAANGFYSPEQDPNFPIRYQQNALFQSYRLSALRDAANQAADNGEAQFVHYAAALTMLAVGVFLFGYALTPQGRARRTLFVRAASGFVVVACGWALFHALEHGSTPPDSAATAFANGEVATNDYQYGQAVADYDRAIKLSPKFVTALFHRATAEYVLGVPHSTLGSTTLPAPAGPVTVPSVQAIDKAAADDARARDQGSTSPTLLANLGADLLYRGLLRHDSNDLRQSLDVSRQAALALAQQNQSANDLVNARFDIAEAELALGDSYARDYQLAEHSLQATDVDTESGVGAALTDLDLIRVTHPALASQVATLDGQVVASVQFGPVALTPNGDLPAKGRPPIRFTGVQLQPDPGHMLYTIKGPGSFNPSDDVLSAQWQYKDPVNGEWAVLPEISGPVAKGGLLPAGPGYSSSNPSYVSLSTPATCLPAGQYKVDLYVNGQLAGSATTPGNWPTLQAARFRQVDAAICAPPNWQPLSVSSTPGADGYFTANASAGVVVFTIPGAALGSAQANPAALAFLMRKVVAGFASSVLPGLVPKGPDQATSFFMNFSDGRFQDWTFNGGKLISGVGMSPSGEIYVGLSYGPASVDVADLFLSISQL